MARAWPELGASVVALSMSLAVHVSLLGLSTAGGSVEGARAGGEVPTSTACEGWRCAQPDPLGAESDATRGLLVPEIAVEHEERAPESPEVESAARSRVLPPPTSVVRGGERIARPDAGRHGRGGSRTASEPGVNLAARDDEVHRTTALPSRLDRAQASRLMTSKHRSSPEDDHVRSRPMLLTFVAEGSGEREEQRPFAALDPAGGGYLARAVPSRAGRSGRSSSARTLGERSVRPERGASAGARSSLPDAGESRTASGAGDFR